MSCIFLRQKELFSFYPVLKPQVPYVFFCNAQSLLLFMHTRPFVFSMQGKNVLSLV